ncbi:hypothetical protein VVD49_18520 [Uliginosibacterium sp. H3]|uniref:Uncharacterized protein n=1 Tax=Uliginosibacterium silvisoli TaxID=3114758 RepID=A0ABU6K829_9RHOO|nr:hypothetical protein [Uliginosibacterium sp. H3]
MGGDMRFKAILALLVTASIASGQIRAETKKPLQISNTQAEILIAVASVQSINQIAEFGVRDLRKQVQTDLTSANLPEAIRLEIADIDSQLQQTDSALKQRRERLLASAHTALVGHLSKARGALSDEFEDLADTIELVAPMVSESLLQSILLAHLDRDLDTNIDRELGKVNADKFSERVGRARCMAHHLRTSAALLRNFSVIASNSKAPQEDFFRVVFEIVSNLWSPDISSENVTLNADLSEQDISQDEVATLAELWFREASRSSIRYCHDNPYASQRTRPIGCQTPILDGSREKWSAYAWASLSGTRDSILSAGSFVAKSSEPEIKLFRNATLINIYSARRFIAKVANAPSGCAKR